MVNGGAKLVDFYLIPCEFNLRRKEREGKITLFKSSTSHIVHLPLLSDINECTLGTHTCHTHATCTNTVGGFNCSCNSGYTGSGQVCSGMYLLR